eukprot:1156987-Pelagomonas_calceolata.AAC.8
MATCVCVCVCVRDHTHVLGLTYWTASRCKAMRLGMKNKAAVAMGRSSSKTVIQIQEVAPFAGNSPHGKSSHALG